MLLAAQLMVALRVVIVKPVIRCARMVLHRHHAVVRRKMLLRRRRKDAAPVMVVSPAVMSPKAFNSVVMAPYPLLVRATDPLVLAFE